jgi:hypothetical protein
MEHTMNMRILLAGLLLAPALITPASANWFSNPFININLNLGSAPSPTPDQVLSEQLPVLVRDMDGNVIAMIDPGSGKVIATAEPQAPKPPRAPAANPSAH